MHLTPAMQDFVLHWGKWGVTRSVAQIHALLHLAPEPMPADEICNTLNLARSNVSTGLKELQGWKRISPNRDLGDRRDKFHSIRDMFDKWHTDMARLPRGVQMAALKPGERIARFLPKSG